MKYLVLSLFFALLLFFYSIVTLLENYVLSLIYTILLITALILSILVTLNSFKSEKTNKALKNIFILFNILLISIVILWYHSIKNIDEIVYLLSNKYMESFEPNNYNEKFNNSNYNGINILYEESVQAAIPTLKVYIDNAKSKCENIFGDLDTSFTIKLDYNKEVFLSRFGKSSNNLLGYYIKSTKTIYLYVKDPNTILIDENNFSKILAHEISHYYLDKFLYQNNILDSSIPVWFNEGIADYISNRIDNLESLEYMPFNEIKSTIDWDNIKSGKQYLQSYYSIKKLVTSNNERILTQLLLALKDYDFNTSFKKVIGKDFADFEKEIKYDIENINKNY